MERTRVCTKRRPQHRREDWRASLSRGRPVPALDGITCSLLAVLCVSIQESKHWGVNREKKDLMGCFEYMPQELGNNQRRDRKTYHSFCKMLPLTLVMDVWLTIQRHAVLTE